MTGQSPNSGGGSSVAMVFRRQGETTGFSLLEKEGDVRVLMEE